MELLADRTGTATVELISVERNPALRQQDEPEERRQHRSHTHGAVAGRYLLCAVIAGTQVIAENWSNYNPPVVEPAKAGKAQAFPAFLFPGWPESVR